MNRLAALLVLALLLVTGPVGSYAHGLMHLHGEYSHGDGNAGHVDHDQPAHHDAPECDLFGAHAPFGTAATAHVPVLQLSVPPLVRAHGAATAPPHPARFAYQSRGPPSPLTPVA